MSNQEKNLKERSDTILEVIKNTPFNFVPIGVIKGLGLDDKDIKNKPFVGVVNTWNELNPGHKHLRPLAEAVKYGIIEAGGVPFEFCTVAPCDGWANGVPVCTCYRKRLVNTRPDRCQWIPGWAFSRIFLCLY